MLRNQAEEVWEISSKSSLAFFSDFCSKNIVISCLLWILSKEHCNQYHSDESAFAGRKKETILLENFSLVHHEVTNLGCFQLVLLLTNVSKTFCPQAKLCIGYFTYTENSEQCKRFLGELLIVFYVQGKRLTDTILEAPKSDPVQLSHI